MPISRGFFRFLPWLLALLSFSFFQETTFSIEELPRSKETYVREVTHGAGLLPWQDRGPSPEELAFRARMEERKTRLLLERGEVRHPRMLTEGEISQASANIASSSWARKWFESRKQLADFLVEQPASYVEEMISEKSPTNLYGFTCPHCVGDKSQEGAGSSLVSWSHKDPDRIECRRCGQTFPDTKYPEQARLECPRMGQSFTYHLNPAEQASPDNRSGDLSWKWVGYPIHLSFEGIVRHKKVFFMLDGAEALAHLYRLEGDDRYAERARDILVRLARCYRNWLYQDYWNTVADCDPLYAAWHDFDLRLEFKRHLCESAFKKDTLEKAGMLQTYWGGGRFSASTDSVSQLKQVCVAYDSVADARRADGSPVWTSEERDQVERDLLLEWLFGAEPFVGGEGMASEHNNKAPRVYHAMAAVGKCLGIASFADTGLRGYEAVRDESFLSDGFSTESPSYTNMYLAELVQIPETLVGFEWPQAMREGGARSENLFASDPQLRRMYAALHDLLLPNGDYPPLADTHEGTRPSPLILEIGLKRYPDLFAGSYPLLNGEGSPTPYALFHLSPQSLEEDLGLHLPELFFPDWMNAFLRHGEGSQSAVISLTFSPAGGHRHRDNLSLYFQDGGQRVLGDHGYVGDMPVNDWIRSTQSHNLVVVDDREQLFGSDPSRQPAFRWMVVSPVLSAAEAESRAYESCSEYRRLAVLLKGPDTQTVAVDIFRAKGGSKHAYRIFSEHAASEATDSALLTEGLVLPSEPPLPVLGRSLERADIFGLRDVRADNSPPARWTATWKDETGGYRLWMLSPADRVEAANGPGQQSLLQAGRRVRYLDTIRSGSDVESVFVAIHEPLAADLAARVLKAERLAPPAEAGPDAVALRVETLWGRYLLLNEFSGEGTVEGVRFKGSMGVFCQTEKDGGWILSSGASTFKGPDWGFEEAPDAWRAEAKTRNAQTLEATLPCPVGMEPLPPGIVSYVAVEGGSFRTGYPVAGWEGNQIRVDRFPLPQVERFELPAVQYLQTRE